MKPSKTHHKKDADEVLEDDTDERLFLSNKDLTALRQWVELNHELIVEYWDCDPMIMGFLDVYDAVKSLPLKGKAKQLASEGGYPRSEELLKALKPLPRQD